MVFTTLFANDKVEENYGDGKIIVSGSIIGSEDCTIYVYEIIDETQVLVSQNDFEDIKFFKAKMKGGSNYLMVFSNGEFTKHLKIENIKPTRNWLGIKRIHLIMDVDFNNRNSAKIKQEGNYYMFDNRL
jgi:hypothetical protein